MIGSLAFAFWFAVKMLDSVAYAPVARDALLSDEALEEHARDLALQHAVARATKCPDPFVSTRRMLRSHKIVERAAAGREELVPASRWLMDHMPRLTEQSLRFSREARAQRSLPSVKRGVYAGWPRAYAVAGEMTAHTQAKITKDVIKTFVLAYQSQRPLRMAELWALPLLIRIALLGVAEKIAGECAETQSLRSEADRWLDQYTSAGRISEGVNHLKPAFVERIAERSRDESIPSGALYWLREQLRARDAVLESVVDGEHRRQSRNQLWMGNLVESLRTLDALNWNVVFEELCPVGAKLAEDPAGVWTQMDFDSRQMYRETVERLSKRLKVPESIVAYNAVRMSSLEADEHGRASRRAHVGWALMDDGLPELQRMCGEREVAVSAGAWLRKRAGALYVLAVPLLTLALSVGSAWMLSNSLPPVFVFLVIFSPAKSAAAQIVNGFVLRVKPPRKLPRLDLSAMPEDTRGVVVVPTLLTSVKRAQEQAEGLELLHLAARMPGVSYVLLGDFKDGPDETQAVDADIINAASRVIACLNERHGELFFYLHRDRKWNQAQGAFMGRERKRGALEDFNRWLLGESVHWRVSPEHEKLADTTHVFTIDADTIVPPGAVARMMGVALHPLNKRAEDGVKVVGRAVFSMRMGMPFGAAKTRLQKLYGGEAGVDAYASANSDVYQALCGEGIYSGKGVYDLRAFAAATEGVFPENAILSHDLIEGLYARAAQVPDVVLYDGHPATVESWKTRLHRWTRGDWQLVPYLLPRTRGADGRWRRVRFSLLDRHKIAHNLERSMLPVGVVCALLLSVAAGSAALGALILALYELPLILDLPNILSASRAKRVLTRTLTELTRLSLLPMEAAVSVDAAVRALYRRFISHRHLLDWVTAADAERNTAPSPVRTTLPCIAVAGAIAVLSFLSGVRSPAPVMFASALIVLFASAPALSSVLSAAPKRKQVLTEDERQFLRQLALRTFRFFEGAVNGGDHHLPPDNVQEEPRKGAARRTSPTNIGLYMASCVGARELGLITGQQMLARLDATMTSVEQLPAHRGHPLNWVSTADLTALRPRYVSTVDSGNLAASLMTVAAALEGQDSINAVVLTQGLRDRVLLALNVEENCEAALAALAVLDMGGADVFGDVARAFEGDSHPLCGEAANAARASEAETRGHADPRHEKQRASLAARMRAFHDQMDFTYLYDATRQMFTIGYDVDNGRMSDAHYDLLASEARLLSFVAIAKGDVAARHFGALGRPMTNVGGGSCLLSWGGTLFEYLLPPVFLDEKRGSLLGESGVNAVRLQRNENGGEIPWGISESGYAAYDLQLNYQYHAFGSPALALKGGLDDSLVIAPYASVMAAELCAVDAVRNMERMASMGWLTLRGFWEAADYTPERAEGKSPVIVRSHMAHHQGMALLSLVNALCDGAIRKHFYANACVRAHDILLQEKNTRASKLSSRKRVPMEHIAQPGQHLLSRKARPSLTPDTHLLAGGGVSVVVTDKGPARMMWNGVCVNRFRADALDDRFGLHMYVSDPATGRWWTAQPRGGNREGFAVSYFPDRAVYAVRRGDIESELTVAVSPEDGAFVQQLRLRNNGASAAALEVTSFFEVSLAEYRADLAHPAFINLFVMSENDNGRIVFTRRPRDAHDRTPVLVHTMIGGDGAARVETDRARFIGRGSGYLSPTAMRGNLSGTVGAVIDPCASARVSVLVPAGESAVVCALTAVCADRAGAKACADAWTGDAASRALAVAATYAQVECCYLRMTAAQFKAFHRAAAYAIFRGLPCGDRTEALRENTLPLSALWRLSVSGDDPIVLVRVMNEKHVALAKSAIRMQEFWGLKGLVADLVILCEAENDYLNPVRDQLARAIEQAGASRTGSVRLLDASALRSGERELLLSASCLALTPDGDTCDISSLMKRWSAGTPQRNAFVPTEESVSAPSRVSPPQVEYGNGFGGFSGDAYIVAVDKGAPPPVPWSNVLANECFGALITECGGGYTWAGNSREFKLTPWSNDPLLDPCAEALWIRDELTGEFVSVAPGPTPPPGMVIVTHAPGVTRFEHSALGLSLCLDVSVDTSRAVKAYTLEIVNRGERDRRLSAVFFADLVLGVHKDMTCGRLITGFLPQESLIWAYNVFEEGMAFVAVPGRSAEGTCDRLAFIGSGGMSDPDALHSAKLDGRFGAGLDACAALLTQVSIPAGECSRVVFLLGAAKDVDEAVSLSSAFDAAVSKADSTGYWERFLDAARVTVPDTAATRLVSVWLPLQTAASRFFARTGFYQAGDAYGFRDQLQDCLLLVYHAPEKVRAHIVRCAGHQFEEGDVQHWWHEPRRGVRTRVSDDLLWLPYVLARYVEITQDKTILTEKARYLRAPQIMPPKEDDYGTPEVSDTEGTVLEHAVLAVRRALAMTGPHGLPLIGTGDWNDAMNRVGHEGQGESVWLAWFIYAVVEAIAPLMDECGLAYDAVQFREGASRLAFAAETHAWDGEWYRRAFDDRGQPLGSKDSVSCKIDCIAQSWAVISNAARPGRARQAMESLEKHLVDEENGIIRLLSPAFTEEGPNRGYISGYVPGVRENGGQYTHAAVWAALAWASLSEGDRAWRLIRMILPVNHADTRESALRYAAEPYVLAADVYGEPPHTGRGGWTWYTGSSAWLSVVILEKVVGLSKMGNRVSFDPCMPRDWQGATLTLRCGSASYRFTVRNARGPLSVADARADGKWFEMIDDGRAHEIIFDRGERT